MPLNGAVVVPLHTHHSSTAQEIQSHITVNLVQFVHIPAYSEMETLVSSTDKVKVRTTWMVEPASKWKLPVRVARALVTLGKGDVPYVRLINPGPTAVTMGKGTTVGLFERFDEANLAVVLPQEMDNANSDSTSTQLWTAIKDNQELESDQKKKLHQLLVEFKDIFPKTMETSVVLARYRIALTLKMPLPYDNILVGLPWQCKSNTGS